MRGLWSLDGGQLFGVNYVRQSPESGMAKLRASMSVEKFDDGYFYAADLKAFARLPAGTIFLLQPLESRCILNAQQRTNRLFNPRFYTMTIEVQLCPDRNDFVKKSVLMLLQQFLQLPSFHLRKLFACIQLQKVSNQVVGRCVPLSNDFLNERSQFWLIQRANSLLHVIHRPDKRYKASPDYS